MFSDSRVLLRKVTKRKQSRKATKRGIVSKRKIEKSGGPSWAWGKEAIEEERVKVSAEKSVICVETGRPECLQTRKHFFFHLSTRLLPNDSLTQTGQWTEELVELVALLSFSLSIY